MNSDIIAIIPARGSSKGIPHKNIIDFCCKPLIVWSIEQAKKSKYIQEVYVSTDDEKIAEVSKNAGSQVIQRPAELANDTTSSEEVLIHTLQGIDVKEIEYVVFLQATSPLRESNDIDKAIEKIKIVKADSLFSACRIGDFHLWSEKDGDLMPLKHDYRKRMRRQEIEKLIGNQYVENGSIYVFKPDVLIANNNRLGGKITFYEMQKWKMFEIDDADELEFCKMVFTLKIVYEGYRG